MLKPLCPIYCVFPSTVMFDCKVSPKSSYFSQVSKSVHSSTEKPSQPVPYRQALCCGRRELSLSLMFGRRRRAWCRSQAGHWWRLAPPFEGLYHQYSYFFFSSFHLFWFTCMSLRSADSDEFKLVCMCSFSLKIYFYFGFTFYFAGNLTSIMIMV